jgi:peptidoglycan-associated lipoprotein
MRTRVPRALPALAIVALIVLAGACARRPVVPVASAPAPSRAVEAPPPAPAPAPVAPPPVAPAPAAPAPPPPPAPVAVAPPPAPALAPVKEFRSSDNVRPIYFDFDKAQVRPGDAKILVANAAWLNANPGYLLLIEGHCDERGTNEYNLALGDRRAKATMEFLVAQGVKMDRMSTISYGEERPTCTSHDEACWAKNRRSQFLVKEQ